ncbi:hypothetical protein ACIRBX_37380 [Kitasatospora sp. NPDC096147]|uniref:hypothetical protein n=1 Tax=Kitasatospora sp. NPDC096147 TaxID=3364093 RepID=UPI00380C3962
MRHARGPQPGPSDNGSARVSRRKLLIGLAIGTALAAVGVEEVIRRSGSGPDVLSGAQPPPPPDHSHAHGGSPSASDSPSAESSVSPSASPSTAATSGEPVPGVAPSTAAPVRPRAWSDQAGWSGGAAPGPGAAVRITDHVLLDRDVTVGSLLVEASGSLTFAPDRPVSLTANGNVEVRGALTLAPQGAATVHAVRFPSVNEGRFQGGGMGLVESDTGLWVTGSGRLKLAGSGRTAWVRAAGALKAGDTSIKLAAAPAGWQVGDELAVTPTGAPDADGFSEHYDYRTVTAVSGATVSLDGPLKYAHPKVTAGGGVSVGAEVLNLTRNVRIEGTEKGRAHVHITSNQRAEVRYAALRWLGPRSAGKEKWAGKPVTEPVLGRYGLHFHMLGDTTRGTVVEGVVVRDTGSHAFVPHNCHGITFRSCIAHQTLEDAYWWDGPLDTRTPQGPSHDITYDSCVASRTQFDPNPRGYRLTGFSLGAGKGGIARDCVAVGVQGANGASGYEWPETSEGVWTFERCLAHNNLENGIFVWLNAEFHHTVGQFVAYHNGGWGIEHGAYLNDFEYNSTVLYGNAAGGVAIHALGRDKGTVFDGLLIDAAGQSDYAVSTALHQLPGETVQVTRSKLTGYRKAGVALRAVDGGAPEDIAVLDCEFSGEALWLDPKLPTPKRVVLRRAGGEAQEIHLSGASTPAPGLAAPRAVVTPRIGLRDVAPVS